MAQKKSKLNQAKSEVIEENILLETPNFALPDEKSGIVFATHIPEMRRVVFLNGRDPGISLDFHYASKTHPLKQYTLHHGQEVDLPVEVIEYLENCAEKVYAYRQGYTGHPEMYVKSLKYIFQCKNAKKAA